MDDQKLLEYLKYFCECVESYIMKYDYAIRTVSSGCNPAELRTLSSLIYDAHLQVLAFGANLTTELYYRGMTESGNIVQGTMDHVLNHRRGYEALRSEWPQREAVLKCTIRGGSGDCCPAKKGPCGGREKRKSTNTMYVRLQPKWDY